MDGLIIACFHNISNFSFRNKNLNTVGTGRDLSLQKNVIKTGRDESRPYEMLGMHICIPKSKKECACAFPA